MDAAKDSMGIECIATPKGRVYKIYRTGDEFVELVRRLLPFMLGSTCDVLIGGTDDDPDVVITFGPLDTETEARFQRRIKR